MKKHYPDFKYWGDVFPISFLADLQMTPQELEEEEFIFLVSDSTILNYGLPKEYWRDGSYYFRKDAPKHEYIYFDGQWYSYHNRPVEVGLGKFNYYSYPPEKEFEAMRRLGWKKLSRHEAKRLLYWEHELDLIRIRRGSMLALMSIDEE